MAENVKVIVRCRPMNKKEQDMKCDCVVKMQNCMVEMWDPHEGPSFPKQFTFDSTYDQESHTESIYNDICYPLVESALEGYNATIFVYGQTGCGKSHTMEGTRGSALDKGVISRTFEHLFEAISVTAGVKYLALISYLEIYNEQIRDLLLGPHEKPPNLNLKESPSEGVTVPGLSSHPVHNAAECEHFLNLGGKNRIIGATLMNQNSSRSHSIFTISIEQISDINETIRKGKLNLVDLAGSERQAKTGATGERLKEATKINLSLSALGNVISALVDGKAKHIPYRDSKLTRLLQDSLGGNTRTLMIACISPSSRDYVETLSTLRYANRAKNIHNKPHVNEDPKDTMLRQYQEEIERLKTLLGNQHNLTVTQEPTVKRERLIQEYQHEMQQLKNLHESEKTEKEKVLKQIETIREDYEENIAKLNKEIAEKKEPDKEEILQRIEALKRAMIGGEKANDHELSERRKRKKMAAEKRASVIAHLLAKIDMNEDRELLHNQYKDISQELNLKTEALRKYRHKVKSLEKEISDIQGEFEIERQDYLETIRKQDQSIKLNEKIAGKMAANLKKECNYSDLEAVKVQSVWLEDAQQFKLPEMVTLRTKLPTPGKQMTSVPGPPSKCRFYDIQTAPGRLQDSGDVKPPDFLKKKWEKAETEDIAGSYFKPTMKRAAELLNQSARLDPNNIINTWRDFARRNKPKSTDNQDGKRNQEFLQNSPKQALSNSYSDLWLNESNRKPFRLEALPNIEKNRGRRLNTLEFL